MKYAELRAELLAIINEFRPDVGDPCNLDLDLADEIRRLRAELAEEDEAFDEAHPNFVEDAANIIEQSIKDEGWNEAIDAAEAKILERIGNNHHYLATHVRQLKR